MLAQVSIPSVHTQSKENGREGRACAVIHPPTARSSLLSTAHGASLKAVPDSCLQFLSPEELSSYFLQTPDNSSLEEGRAGLGSQSWGKARWQELEAAGGIVAVRN